MGRDRPTTPRHRETVVTPPDLHVPAGAPSGAASVKGWAHTCLTVTDLDVAIEFYVSAFGYEVVFEARGLTDQIERMLGRSGVSCDLAHLRLSGSEHVLELISFLHHAPGDEEPRGLTRAGAGHVAFVVPELEVASAAVERLGAVRLGEVTRFSEGRSLYLRDPAGAIFELDEPVVVEEAEQ